MCIRDRYNGIEHCDDFGLDLDMAFYRSYDAAIGRWNQIDPKYTYSQSPYSGMGNNPITYSDFLGDTLVFPNTNSQFGHDTDRDLHLIYRSNSGKQLLRHMHSHERSVEFYDASSIFTGDQGDVLNSITRSSGPNQNVLWHNDRVNIYYAQREAFEFDGTNDTYSFLILAHELFHGKDLSLIHI